MRQRIYWLLSLVLQVPAFLLCLAAWIPLMYPVILLSGGLLAVLCLVLLVSYPYASVLPDRPSKQIARGTRRNRWILRIREYGVSRRIFRSLVLSLFAMIFSFGFMGFLKLYSWFFYIQPMSRELEPYRKLYRRGQKDFRPLSPKLKQ